MLDRRQQVLSLPVQYLSTVTAIITEGNICNLTRELTYTILSTFSVWLRKATNRMMRLI